MSRKLNHRGFTLVEVMVFSAVSVVFLALIAQVFIMATRRTEDSRLRVDIQQNAVFIMNRFEDDFLQTSARALVASDSSRYTLCFTPAETWSTVGNVNWSPQQVLYIHDKASNTLYREQHQFQSPSFSGVVDLYVPTLAELDTVANTSSTKKRQLSSQVEEFSLSDRSGSKTTFQSQPLILQMKLRRALSSSDRFAEFTVEKRYTLRNFF